MNYYIKIMQSTVLPWLMPCLAVCFMLILCYYIYQDKKQLHNIYVYNINFEFLLSCQQQSNEEIHFDTYEYIAREYPQIE